MESVEEIDRRDDSLVTLDALPADERAFVDRHFGYDRLPTATDLDLMWAAEMEARDALARYSPVDAVIHTLSPKPAA